ncbi:MAG: hypothetical protein ACTSU9_06930, partial [Promethearchaeota archaeon]
IAPILACVAYAAVLYLFMFTLWPLLEGLLGLGMEPAMARLAISAAVLLSMIFIFPGTFYSPFLGLFGAWDDYTLEELRKSIRITGPSRWNMNWMFKITTFCTRRCKFRNKHPLGDYAVIEQQMAELTSEVRTVAGD